MVINHVIRRRPCWCTNKAIAILWLMFCIIIELNSQKTFLSFVLCSNMAAMTWGETFISFSSELLWSTLLLGIQFCMELRVKARNKIGELFVIHYPSDAPPWSPGSIKTLIRRAYVVARSCNAGMRIHHRLLSCFPFNTISFFFHFFFMSKIPTSFLHSPLNEGPFYS